MSAAMDTWQTLATQHLILSCMLSSITSSKLQYNREEKLILLSWLHHCNVDRLIALFQASHPNLHITPLEDPIGTWTIVPGSTDTTQTPLKPFTSNTGGTFWTSDSAWSLSPFGYSYPEIQDVYISKIRYLTINR